jgi:predicted PurR-regulated permease PerM
MNDQQQIKKNQSTILLIILFLGAFLMIFFGFKPKEQTQTQNTFSSITTTKDVEQWLGNLPDSTFKSNLLVVFGAEYGGDSEELNKLLNAFIEIRIQELTNEKKI